MKKLLVIGTLVLLIFTLAACGKKQEEETAAQETDPMAMLSKDEDFLKQLGFGIDSTAIPVRGMARFVVNGKMAQLRFAIEREGTTPMDVNFRATKDEEQKANLCDAAGEESEPVSLTVAGLPVTQKDIVSDDMTYHSYYFEKDGVYCCATVTSDLTEEELEALIGAFRNAVITEKTE